MAIYSWLITIFWLIFLVYWLVSAMSAKKRMTNSPHARGVGLRIAIFIIIFLILQLPIFGTFAAYFDTFFTNPLVNILGVILCGLGVAFAIWARYHLGRNWGMPMSIQKEAELVTSGPYALVRNPIYIGGLLALFGSMLVGGFFWLVFLVVTGVYFIYSLKVEEKLMEQQFPQTYPKYKKRTKALIPFIF
jgi:protein-S-isoprenylcysteine O-methyltransferase Ste14